LFRSLFAKEGESFSAKGQMGSIVGWISEWEPFRCVSTPLHLRPVFAGLLSFIMERPESQVLFFEKSQEDDKTWVPESNCEQRV
jgi:hypothetical protein